MTYFMFSFGKYSCTADADIVYPNVSIMDLYPDNYSAFIVTVSVRYEDYPLMEWHMDVFAESAAKATASVKSKRLLEVISELQEKCTLFFSEAELALKETYDNLRDFQKQNNSYSDSKGVTTTKWRGDPDPTCNALLVHNPETKSISIVCPYCEKLLKTFFCKTFIPHTIYCGDCNRISSFSYAGNYKALNP